MKRAMITIIILFFIFHGCDDTAYDGETDSSLEYEVECIDGVEYIKGFRTQWGYMSPHFKKDGTLYLCGKRE